jgi:hypothetical protein
VVSIRCNRYDTLDDPGEAVVKKPENPGEHGATAKDHDGRQHDSPINQWDVAIYVLKLLGWGAPYLLIIAASVFAVFKFHEQSQNFASDRDKAVREATKDYQQQISAANKALIDTYSAIPEISQRQMKNLNDLVEFETKEAERTRGFQRDADRLAKETEDLKRKLDEVSRQADTAVAQKKQAENDLQGLQQTLDSAVSTLAAIGTLVDSAPDLLRAAATTDAVQNILQKSDDLIVDSVTRPELRYRKMQILLAFANLEEFVGAVDKQEKLAKAALALIGELRTSGQEPAGIHADEAAAHVMLGSAFGAQHKFDPSVKEINNGIRLFDVALAKNRTDMRTVKWRQAKGEAYLLLGVNTYLFREDPDDAIRSLRVAADIFQGLEKEDSDDPARKVAVASAHKEIAEIERNEQNLYVALREYDLARSLMETIGEKVYRNNHWLDALARIYNGRALLLLEQVEHLARERQTKGVSADQTADIERTLEDAFEQVKKASGITEILARDEKNAAWQSAHAYSLHNLGAVKLSRGQVMAVDGDLDESVTAFRQALAVRNRLHALAPASAHWLTDARWTQVNLNEAEATRAKRNADYIAMRDLFDKNVKLVSEQLDVTPQADDWHYQKEANRTSYGDALALLNQADKARGIYAEVRTEATTRMTRATQSGAKDRWAQLIQRIDKAMEHLGAQTVR